MIPRIQISRLLNQLFWQSESQKDSDQKFTLHSKSAMQTIAKDLANSENGYPIPVLTTVNAMVSAIQNNLPKNIDLSKVVIIAVQHNLETTVTLFQSLKKLGVAKIYTLGKCYSDSPPIVQAMIDNNIQLIPSSKPQKIGQYQQAAEEDVKKLWSTCLDDIRDKDIDIITILDDGGRCLAGMPSEVPRRYKVAGVEQTRGGLYLKKIKDLLCPIVDVASSALKRWVEPPFIAKAVIRKMTDILKAHGLMYSNGLPNKNMIIGVAGVGAIGSAIARYLMQLGYAVNIYDTNENAVKKANLNGATRIDTFKTFVANSQCIFGCTGEDLTKNLPQGISLTDIVEQDTIFISCSSEDKEYRGELERIAHISSIDIQPLKTFTARSLNKSKMTFVRGGFPANFDGAPWNVPAQEIEPTQASLLGAVFQAILSAKIVVQDGITLNGHLGVMLDPNIQRFILETRCKLGTASGHEKTYFHFFQDISWIKNESGMHNYYDENSSTAQHIATCFAGEKELTYSPKRSRL